VSEHAPEKAGRTVVELDESLLDAQLSIPDPQPGSVSRAGLNVALLNAAGRLPGVRIHFGFRCTDGDIERGSLELTSLDGGLSNVTAKQVAEARAIAPVVCVQNHYNLVHRHDDSLVDALAGLGVAYVPFFPLGGFAPLQSQALSEVAAGLGATPMQVALAWLLRRSPNILLIPGTSSLAHLRENLAAAELTLTEEALARLDAIGRVAA